MQTLFRNIFVLSLVTSIGVKSYASSEQITDIDPENQIKKVPLSNFHNEKLSELKTRSSMEDRINIPELDVYESIVKTSLINKGYPILPTTTYAFENSGGEFIGTISIEYRSADQFLNLSYVVMDSQRGHGFAAQMVKMMLPDLEPLIGKTLHNLKGDKDFYLTASDQLAELPYFNSEEETCFSHFSHLSLESEEALINGILLGSSLSNIPALCTLLSLRYPLTNIEGIEKSKDLAMFTALEDHLEDLDRYTDLINTVVIFSFPSIENEISDQISELWELGKQIIKKPRHERGEAIKLFQDEVLRLGPQRYIIS